MIIKNGNIISSGYNSVTKTNDPTAHAEINAIRSAAEKLSTFDLSGCEIYSSCEPCPMCLAAIYWAHCDKIYYAASRNDAQNAGFNDSYIYTEICLNPEARSVKQVQMLRDEALEVFNIWKIKEGKIEY